MIVFKRLEWSNCFSYGPDNHLNLDANNLTQIIGTNGVGKSSIPLILEEILYNKNSKGIKKADIPNRDIDSGYSINLTFEKDHTEYKIEVVRKGSIKVKLFCGNEDISSHTATNTYKTIEDLMGVDFKTFSQLVYQNTSASLQFLTATDANRKKFLIDLLSLEKYVELFEVFKEASKELSQDLARLEGKSDSILSWFEKNKLSDTKPQTPIILKNIAEEDESTLHNLLMEFKNIEIINKKINENNKYRELLDKIDINEISNIEVSAKKSIAEHRSELAEETAKVSLSIKAIKKMENLGDYCHTCEQEIDSESKTRLVAIEQDIKSKSNLRIEYLKELIAGIEENNALFDYKLKMQAEWERLYNSIDDTLSENTLEASDIQNNVNVLRTKIDEIKNYNKKATTSNLAIERHNTKIDVVLEQTEELTTELKIIEKEVSELEVKNTNLSILKKAFSNDGLLAYKIENLVGELEDLTNEYLAELSGGRFTLGFVVLNDKLNVEITDNEKIVDILALSSGELARVNTATLLAIRKLMSSISKSQINVLFLDEVINVLDEAGKEKIVEVLLEEELNTYLVSHQWQHPLLSKVLISKSGGVSVIEES